MKKWLDNFGKADNANESNVSLSEDFVGLAYDTSGRNYSPAWGGQFQNGGELSYDDWKKKYELQESPNYNLRRAYELGYEPVDRHLPSIDSQTGDFLKLKGHPTLFKEIQYWQTNPELNKSMFPSMKPDGNLQYNPRTMQSGGSIPGSVGFTYARTAGSAPSEGKYAKKTMPSAQKGKKVQENVDSTLENILEVFDPTGISSWDDVYQSYQESGMSPQTKLEIFGALPLLGKVGKAGKFMNQMSKVGAKAYQKDAINTIGKLLQSTPYIGRGTDVIQAAQQFPEAPFFPTAPAPPANVGQFGRYAGASPLDLKKSEPMPASTDMHVGLLKKIADYMNSQSGKFQNGGEMKFYQEGLDWKPKSMRDGGITKDDQGYWNPDNWGKPVEIDSNNITMQGVYEPLIGISDTGDTKLMEPGNDYKFKGSKVTEIPVAKLGINQLDAQPKKKLNQLLNFTNNPDKTNWLDKYQ